MSLLSRSLPLRRSNTSHPTGKRGSGLITLALFYCLNAPEKSSAYVLHIILHIPAHIGTAMHAAFFAAFGTASVAYLHYLPGCAVYVISGSLPHKVRILGICQAYCRGLHMIILAYVLDMIGGMMVGPSTESN